MEKQKMGLVKTGIFGLDRLLNGGFVKGSTVVVIGPVCTL
jgi:KaiC/GvpD/RAD55 family RecA-like ATPase